MDDLNINSPERAIAAMRFWSKLQLPTEEVSLADATGRRPVGNHCLDRPSPALDVSSMDGYALRLSDLGRALPLQGIAAAGQPPTTLDSGHAIKIFTGAPIPVGADLVIKREDATESDNNTVSFRQLQPRAGQFIRRAGENGLQGMPLPDGPITPAIAAAFAAAGIERVSVRRKLRIAILTTGDEIVAPGAQPAPHQLRDANGPALTAMFRSQLWSEVFPVEHVHDDLSALTRSLAAALERADAVLLTGGVSMGDLDHVPAAIAATGARTVFHKLPTRPGKPLLGAVSPTGQPIIGLPGNPVSVLTTARWFALHVLSQLAGVGPASSIAVSVANPDDETIPLHWFRLARWIVSAAGQPTVALLPNKGSGDIIAAATSDGFVHISPNQRAEGTFRFYPWDR